MDLRHIDRAIYESIRLKLVALGYLPDITAYATPQLYLDAKIALAGTLASGETVIEVFGTGSPESRGEKIISRITVNRNDIKDGSLRTYGVRVFEPYEVSGQTKFKKLKFPSSNSKNIIYNIRILSNSVLMERKMLEILNAVFDDVVYLKALLDNGDAGDEFEMLKRTFMRIPTTNNIIEWLISYEVIDVFLWDMITVKDNIAPLTDIDFNIKTLKLNEDYPE